MIKASLTYHDPLDIYDHFKSEYGTLSMIIKGNNAIITFENPVAKKQILQNPRRVIKGLPLFAKPFQEEEPSSKVEASKNLANMRPLQNQMDLEQPFLPSEDLLMLGDSISLPNIHQPLRLVGAFYQKKIKQIKSTFLDQQICNSKITEFNTFVSKYIKNNETLFQDPFKNLKLAIKRYSLNPQGQAIDLEPNYSHFTNRLANFSKKLINTGTTYFCEGTQYASYDVASVKRLCLLNENNFISTLKLNQKNQQKGQLRIYNKQSHAPSFSLDIQEVPYSLMMHDNFVLSGDFAGHIHFIDIENNNRSEYSNKLSTGLIVQMQKYTNKNSIPLMMTLLSGSRNDYKVKIFQIEKENINYDIKTLTFHPKEEMLCEGITMTLQVLDDGKFAYGCGRNTYICPSFDKRERDYITHDQNVMKIKKRNAQQLIQATERKIVLMDLRASKLKNEIFDFKLQLNTIELLSQNLVFYGGKMGEIGLIDCRKPNVHIWNPSTYTHRGKIADILKMGNDVVTADSFGSILQWKNQELK